MENLIQEYERLIESVEGRIAELEEELKKPHGNKEHDDLVRRLTLLNDNRCNLIYAVHQMKRK